MDNKCPDLTPEMKAQASCLAAKIQALSPPIAYSGPSATIRNTAYQKHLRAVWDKWEEINNKKLSDAGKQACAAVIADAKIHWDQHKFDAPPSKKSVAAPHVLGKAIDIPKATVNALVAQVTLTSATVFVATYLPGCTVCTHIPLLTGDVEDYVNSTFVNPPACNLRWGGRFTPYDPVHFQLP